MAAERIAVVMRGPMSSAASESGDTPMGLLGALTASMHAWSGSSAEVTDQIELARRLTLELCRRLDRTRRAEVMR